MNKIDFCKNNIRIKLVETQDELNQARRLRYEELVLFHRSPDDITLEETYDAWDKDCDHLIAIDLNTNQVVGCYRLIMRKHLPYTGGFVIESNFNIDDIKNSSKEILEMGRAAVKEGYRDGFVIKMLFAGLFKYVDMMGVELVFGFISIPEMPKDEFENLLGYFYTMATTDEDLQPFAKEPCFSLNVKDAKDVNIIEAKRSVPPVLKAYIAMGCKFATTGSNKDKLLHTKDVLVMLDMQQVNKRYIEFITREVKK